MRKKWSLTYNPWFFFPFLAWVVVGGALLLLFTKEQLFHAVNSHYSSATDVLLYYMTWLGEGWFIVVLLLVLLSVSRFRNLWFFITVTLCSVIPLAIQQGLKEYYKAPRPRAYFPDVTSMHFLPNWPSLVNNSFPSGHSEGAFSFFCLASLLIPEKYSKFGLLFFLLAIGVCYSRIYLTAHFFEDVYAGSIIGGITTTLVYSVMYVLKGRFSKENID